VAPSAVEREVLEPRGYAWVLFGLLALGGVYLVAPARLHGHWLFVTPLALAVGIVVLRKLWYVPPAPAMCAGIVLTVFSGGWARMGLGGLPFDRLLIVTVLLAVFLRAPGVARLPRLQLRNVHLLMCLTMMYAVASAVTAGTLTQEISLLSLIDRVGLVPYLLFLVAPVVFSGERERDLLLAVLVGLGVYIGFTAIFESLGPHSLVFPHYVVQADAELRGERAGGPFQSTVSEGFATFACAVAAVMAFARWRGQRKRYFAAVVALVCIFGCFLTLERGVWIAAVTATAVAALATRTGRRWFVPGVVLCTLLIGVPLALSPALSSKTSARVNRQVSVWDRENQSAAALKMIQAKPLLGFGWYGYTANSLEYFRQAMDYPMVGYATTGKHLQPLHDTYLAYAVELGLVGTALWLATLLWGVIGTALGRGSPELRPWKLGLLAIGVFFVVVGFFDPYPAPFPTLLLWVWAGVALGSAPLSEQARRAKSTALVRRERAWGMAERSDPAVAAS
jgi:putative inorganic carbon (HCO3(-)) transporter